MPAKSEVYSTSDWSGGLVTFDTLSQCQATENILGKGCVGLPIDALHNILENHLMNYKIHSQEAVEVSFHMNYITSMPYAPSVKLIKIGKGQP